MNKLPIKRKVERAFAQDFIPKHLTARGLNIYEGHVANDGISLPALIVFAEDSQEHSDMPTSTGVRVVRLRIGWQVDAADQIRADIDEWKEQIECSILNREKIQETLNAPDSGIDRRKVTNIHFHDAMITGDPSDREETDWIEQQVFDVIVEDL